MLLPGIIIKVRALSVLDPVLAVPFFSVRHVEHDHEGGAGDKNELQGPESDVGDGEVVVVADVGASGLACITVEVSLVVAPDSLRSHHKDQDTEDEHHGQPYAPEGCGVLVDSTEETFKKLPIHLFKYLFCPEMQRNDKVFRCVKNH